MGLESQVHVYAAIAVMLRPKEHKLNYYRSKHATTDEMDT